MDQRESTNKKVLFSCAMKGEWGRVIEMYKEDSTFHKARITRSGHTALHIAVSDGKEDVVRQMVDVIKPQQPQEEPIKALRTHNNRNNTALHLAASMGNATMCHIIASVERTLVDDRNADGETPLFLAALHGRKQAFLCLHSIRNPPNTDSPFYVNCRRNDGDTILHSAINGDHFDLALQIIHLYKDLANWVNEKGLSPLHLLASKPCAFKSGSRLGRMETIIYHCMYVEELQPQTLPGAAKHGDSHGYPDNYNTSWNVFKLIRKAVDVVLGKPCEANAEDPEAGAQASSLFPANYRTCCHLIKFFYLVLLIILGKGSDQLRKIYRKKEIHTRSAQIVKQLLHYASSYEYEDDGSHPEEGYSTTLSQDATPATSVKPTTTSTEDKKDEQNPKRGAITETAILVAAKNGVMEIIEKILELFPVAIHDLNEDKKNIVLLAVEHRQPHVYQFLLKKNIYKESLFHQVDKHGNSVLHLAATLRDYKPWLIPGEALQMQWELKWYKFVNEPMPPDFFGRYNLNNETPDDIFSRTHKDLVKSAAEWLNKTSESCSVVAALIATVAFATAATVPGGVKQETGHPTLEYEPGFQLFAISSLVALGFSITAVVMFLSIMTSRFQEQNFNKDLPRKLLVGLTSLFISIASMLVSFCAGHFFVLKDQLHYVALPIYLVTCLPVTLFVLAQFPLYFDLLWATFKHVPQRSYRTS
ncbi:uncharacterized protein LOC129290956 [Prosopis cineraria]|uniref:uncharacterized protein LOC129290956 n=1 Tax=Prosopis cineraria TaxID=364024 RepID=UPI00240F0441|nr:uncharacterized protein LOC129290956 [Prosopis cineraria]XP_054783992.1 uncharacterized protein LOC129290956 [Prosopis cineraria]